MKKHWAICINNDSDKKGFIKRLLGTDIPEEFMSLKGRTGMLFSKTAVRAYINKEIKHGDSGLAAPMSQDLNTMSSGEQKKALLQHILSSAPDFILLDNPFDNLDIASQRNFKQQLNEIAKTTQMVQLLSRRHDLLPFITNYYQLHNASLIALRNLDELANDSYDFNGAIPHALTTNPYKKEILIQLKDISVSYAEKPILHQINWTIKKGEFWELSGPNGSGKTTILSMITGENPKGYGQDLSLFGQKKGSGESVWDIKKNIGYFSPALTDSFTGYFSLEHMLISGLNDSIGLYTEPTEAQLRLAKEWLEFLKLSQLKDRLFRSLSTGQKRLVMCARAMIKHPILLILDEPTAGLDDLSASLFVAMVNKFAFESETAIIFVSHRREPGLSPQFRYELQLSEKGSIGKQL